MLTLLLQPQCETLLLKPSPSPFTPFITKLTKLNGGRTDRQFINDAASLDPNIHLHIESLYSQDSYRVPGILWSVGKKYSDSRRLKPNFTLAVMMLVVVRQMVKNTYISEKQVNIQTNSTRRLKGHRGKGSRWGSQGLLRAGKTSSVIVARQASLGKMAYEQDHGEVERCSHMGWLVFLSG